MLRLTWAGAMLLLLGVAWVATSPGAQPEPIGSWDRDLSAAAAENIADNVRTSGAPQQQVVNGWYANNLANIHADQLRAQYAQSLYLGDAVERFTAVLGVMALTLIGDIALRAVPARILRRPSA